MLRKSIVILAALLVCVLVWRTWMRRTRDGFCGDRINCPTRNMSYDLRGEAAYPRRQLLPYMYSTIGPEDPASCVFRRSLQF